MTLLNLNVYLIQVLESIIVKLSYQEQLIAVNVFKDIFLKMPHANHVNQQSKTVLLAHLVHYQQHVKRHAQHVFPHISCLLIPSHKGKLAVHVKFMVVKSVKYP